MAFDDAAENGHRHVAAEHDRIVERLEVVAHAEIRLCLAPQPVDLAVPDLVAAGLTRPGAVAVDFAGDLLDRRSVGLGEPADRLLARPPFRMKAGIDDEAAGAKRNRLQVAEPADRIAVIDAKLSGE